MEETLSVVENVTSLDKNVDFLGKKVKGITGSTIKMIAIITMFIDHAATVLIEPILIRMAENAGNDYSFYSSAIYKTYNYMRSIGRLGFPIFCFLLVEGFIHTRSRLKYVIRLGIFAIVSEVPFDLAFNGAILEFTYQNVFFTLFLGMCVLIGIDQVIKAERQNKAVRVILSIAIIMAGMFLAKFMMTDYDSWGVLTIALMYLLRNYKNAEMFGGCMALTFMSLGEAYAFLTMIPIALYNGKRGWKLKYIFYIFYPGHLLLLAGIARLFHLQ